MLVGFMVACWAIVCYKRQVEDGCPPNLGEVIKEEGAMRILVTNDDGVTAPGLLALAQAMEAIPGAEVLVVAPHRNWSVTGHVKTLNRPLRVWETVLADGRTALTTEGAPSDCVAMALLGLVPRPDVVVSGINPNANVGHDVTYSGTVTAAMEAVIAGVPAVAVSLERGETPMEALDYRSAARVARRIVAWVLSEGLPEEVLLNVNVPYRPLETMQGIRVTRLGRRLYRDRLTRCDGPAGKTYYWIGGEPPAGVPEEGTDIGALAQGYVSVTPLQMDMTAYGEHSALAAAFGRWVVGEEE